jgi:hypothetical protein
MRNRYAMALRKSFRVLKEDGKVTVLLVVDGIEVAHVQMTVLDLDAAKLVLETWASETLRKHRVVRKANRK